MKHLEGERECVCVRACMKESTMSMAHQSKITHVSSDALNGSSAVELLIVEKRASGRGISED